MTVAEPWTAEHNTPNKSVRQNVARKGCVLHHGVTTSLDALRAMEMGGKQVSSTSIIKDDLREEMFRSEENWRAWSLSDAWGDSSFRSVETCDETLAPNYSISDASHWSLAFAVAWWAQMDGFWPQRDGGNMQTWTVLGHREFFVAYGRSYATACPGGMDLNLVTARAQDILRGTTPIKPKGTQDMTQYWQYDSSDPAAKGRIFAADPTRLSGRYLAGWEVGYLLNDVNAGRTQLATLSEPDWTNTISRYRDIGDKPEQTGGSVTLTAQDKAEIAAAVAKLVQVPTEFNIVGKSTATKG